MWAGAFCRCALAVLALVAAATTNGAFAQINTQQAMRIGKNAIFFEDYVLAIQYFNQVIAVKPHLAEPYHCRAVAKISLEDYIGARDDASMSIDRNPFVMENYRIRAVARHNLHDFAGAIEDYRICIAEHPDDKDLLMNMAICEYELKDYEHAMQHFKHIAERDTTNSQARIGIAQLLMAKNDTAQALQYLTDAISINKNDVQARLQRCDIYWNQLGDKQRALDDLDEVIKLEPAHTEYYINRAYMRYKNDDYEGAMSDFNYVISLEPDNVTAHYDRALLRTEVGEDNAALDDYEKVLKHEPDNEAALHNRASLYMKTGQYRKAIAALTDLLRHDPKNFVALYNRAMLNMNTRQYRAAADDLTKVLAKYPKFESGYMMRAAARKQLGDQQGMNADMKRAMAIMKAKGVHYSNYNPIHHEVRLAEEQSKLQAEQRAAQQAELEEKRRQAAQRGDTIAEPTQEQVAEKFNELLTVKLDNSFKPEYNNRSRGHVQNDHSAIEPAGQFILSYHSVDNELQGGRTHFMREVTQINQLHLLPAQLSLVCDLNEPLDEEASAAHFAALDSINKRIGTLEHPRAVDFFARAMEHFTLKDFGSAIDDATRAIAADKRFTLAQMLLFNATMKSCEIDDKQDGSSTGNADDIAARKMLRQKQRNEQLQQLLTLINNVIKTSPSNACAFYNRGRVLAMMGNNAEAIDSYSMAIAANPELGEAYFNRGLLRLAAGDKALGNDDLSKAGELGMMQSYSIMKRMRN